MTVPLPLALILAAAAPFLAGVIAIGVGAPEWAPYAALGSGLVLFAGLAVRTATGRASAALLATLFALVVGLRIAQGGDGPPEGGALAILLAACVLLIARSVFAVLREPLAIWLARRRTGFTETMAREVVVPPGPGSRPGESVLSHSDTLFSPSVGEDGARGDFRVLVGKGGSTMSAVCLGTVAEHGEPRESAREALNAAHVSELMKAQDLIEDEIGGEPAVCFRLAGAAPCVAYDWRFNHAGWAFSAGVLCHPRDDEDTVVRRTRAILDTWSWRESADAIDRDPAGDT